MKSLVVTAAVATLALAGCQKQAGDNAASGNPATPSVTTPALNSAPSAAPAATTGPTLGQANDSTGELRMDVTEATRAGGVLTIKTRFTQIGGKPSSHALPGASGDQVYVTAADKKYLLLKDDHDKELMSSNLYPTFAEIGSTQTWWGKYPAPGPEVKAVNFYFYGFDPVENVAITDR